MLKTFQNKEAPAVQEQDQQLQGDVLHHRSDPDQIQIQVQVQVQIQVQVQAGLLQRWGLFYFRI